MLRPHVAPSLALLALALGCAGTGPAPEPGSGPGSAAPRSEPRVAWLREHAVPVRSVDPADEDVSDLRPLAPILADRRVVILGEGTHGDGTAFLAKSRLVRFLHRELGFDVLAFESGFYDCWKAWQRIEAGKDPEEAFRGSVFPIWILRGATGSSSARACPWSSGGPPKAPSRTSSIARVWSTPSST